MKKSIRQRTLLTPVVISCSSFLSLFRSWEIRPLIPNSLVIDSE